MKDIVGTVGSITGLTTAIRAIEAAGLTEMFKGPGPFTLFAPSDGAFAVLPEPFVSALLSDVPALNGIIKQHVLPGRYPLERLSPGEELTTIEGTTLAVGRGTNAPMINGSTVLRSDISCSNGIVHVIDRVLLPNLMKAVKGIP